MGTIIIAEAGVNHNGNLNLAKALIVAAAEAGADYVKFQTFKAENLVSKEAPKAEYQKVNMNQKSGSQFEMLKKLELSYADHQVLIDYCQEQKIKFLSTPFDLESADLLHELGVDYFKISSGDISNLPLLEKVSAYGKQVIISSGMSTMDDVKAALKVIEKNGTPKKNTIVLHCNTEYPTPFEHVNLKAMQSIAAECAVAVGYSDHTLGIEVPIAAVALGAVVIEKHFTLDKTMEGPDHKASLDPAELKEMVKSIRNIEKALGSADKVPSPSEIKNMNIARKSIHLNKNLSAAAVLTKDDLIMLRPGDGISPMEMEKVIGRKLKVNCSENHKLSLSDLI